MNQWQLQDATRLYQEVFDLKGLSLKSISLDWYPYIELSECETNSGSKATELQCSEAKGLYPSISEALETALNFTMTNSREPSGNWGSNILSKLLENNSVSIGNTSSVMTKVLAGAYDVSFAPWSLNSDRAKLVEYLVRCKDHIFNDDLKILLLLFGTYVF